MTQIKTKMTIIFTIYFHNKLQIKNRRETVAQNLKHSNGVLQKYLKHLNFPIYLHEL